MDIYNSYDQQIKTQALLSLFDEIIAKEEIFEGIHAYTCLVKREHDIKIQLAFTDYETYACISIIKNDQMLTHIVYKECDQIKILCDKDKVIEIKNRKVGKVSKTILSLRGEPILQFFDD